MGGKGGGSKPATAPVPNVDTASENAKQLAEVALRRKGRKANVLTGNAGVDNTAGVVSKELLGGPK